MKTEIHPEYVECRVTCSCGNQFLTRATVPELRVELCAECHPFYTGKQKLVDTGGRVERFTRRYAQAQEAAERAGVGASETAPAKPRRKKRTDEAPKRKPPVVTKGGPRPKYEPRSRGEHGDRRDERGDARRGRGKKPDDAPAREAAPDATPEAPAGGE